MNRGVRGATTVLKNESGEIIERAAELMIDIVSSNDIAPEDVTSVYFTVTDDIDAVFPAKALRRLEGWTYVPVMCMREIPVPGSLEKCIRVMVTVETERTQQEIRHIYHYEAKQLRPDLKSTEE
ncbi:chorismate mutase [Halobacillus sp. ACCC02827]|uniref:chorismate mutase n=1 Tax=unclassified Halobacillus TaxID=2636472 RepID=UPI0002A5078F|nr:MULTISPECIES: chorismate mutase [unclassified Halobacillus]ELK45331.1 chorismate mutase [Halobacillus sp. BAB-2008]WJE14090.1 chorismate mutase [Halobacillus sp. ACCC02827]